MKSNPHIVCPWLTPKIFTDFDDPHPQAAAFFEHYQEWFGRADQVVLNFCTGNGDHILRTWMIAGNFLFQQEIYAKHGARCQGVSFFANDTFGHFVMPKPLEETLAVVGQAHGWENS